LIFPKGTALTTVPRAFVPAGTTLFPSTTTAEASLALNVSPAELIFDPTASPRRIVSVVPAGITTGGGGGGGAGAAAGAGAVAAGVEADVAGELIAPPEFPDAVLAGAAILLAVFEVVSAGLLEQATNSVSSNADNTHSARERMIFLHEEMLRQKL